jgi:hypothetical protein
MKNYFRISMLLLTSILFSNLSSAQNLVVGEIISGVPTVTVDKPALMATYAANLLNESGGQLNYTFTDVNIVQNGAVYYLVFTGVNVRSSLPTDITPGGPGSGGIVNVGYGDGGTVSCTTSDCVNDPNRCVPGTQPNTCIPCAGHVAKCSRTVSNSNMCM